MKLHTLLAGVALTLGAAHAQLMQTPQATLGQETLKGFSGITKPLKKGEVSLTLDTAAGYVIGLYIEGPMSQTADVARAMAGGWGMSLGDAANLQRTLESAGFQAEARQGLSQSSGPDSTDQVSIKLTGEGNQARWKVYQSVSALPESTFAISQNAVGSAQAPMTLYVFSDFQCPYCQRLWMSQIKTWREQPNQYRVVHLHYPLPMHPNAFAAAEASECAAAQKGFETYGDILFNKFSEWTPLSGADAAAKFKAYAAEAKLDTAKFGECVDSHATRAAVQAQMNLAQKLGVQGTPTVFMNGMRLGNYTDGKTNSAIRAITTAKPSAGDIITERLKNF